MSYLEAKSLNCFNCRRPPLGTIFLTSAIPDTGIEPGINQIDRKINEHEYRLHDHHQRLCHVVVLVKDGFDQQPAKAVKIRKSKKSMERSELIIEDHARHLRPCPNR